jgi:hypothetical protein
MALEALNLTNPSGFSRYAALLPKSIFKSIGPRPPRRIHNPIELMLFTRWSGQRIDTFLSSQKGSAL